MGNQVQNVSKQKRWQSHIADWKISKLSQREYCELKQLSLNTFTYWRSKFKKSNTAETKKNNSLSAFQKVTFSTEKASKATILKLQYPRGITITLYSEPTPALLKLLLSTEGYNGC